ncbi:unnamed protein product [Coccothraustes coccothraustes]
MGRNWSCPICQGTQNDTASVLPCHHQFCLGCILRWALRNPSCPLCRTLVRSIRFSEQNEWDYLQCTITPSSESPEASSQAGGSTGELTVAQVMRENDCHYPVVSHPSSPQETLSLPQQASAGPEPMADILPEVWAELFQQQQHLLDPVLPWLCKRLQRIFRGKWWLVHAAESSILNDLCVYGLDMETLVLRLQKSLGEGTAQLVHGLINVIVGQCSKEAQRLLHSHTNEEETHRPSANTRPASSSSNSSSSSSSYVGISASSPTSSNVDEEAGLNSRVSGSLGSITEEEAEDEQRNIKPPAAVSPQPKHAEPKIGYVPQEASDLLGRLKFAGHSE